MSTKEIKSIFLTLEPDLSLSFQTTRQHTSGLKNTKITF